MKVAYISADWGRRSSFDKRKTPGGACYYRCVLPAQALSEFAGIDTACFDDATTKNSGEIVPLDDDKRPVDGWDVIVLQRWMRAEIDDLTLKARSTGQLVVQDIDDHFWALHKANAAHDVTDPTKNPTWNRDHYADTLRAASLVTTSTPFLADVVRGLGQPNVVVLRNMIDLRNWRRQSVNREVRTIGWVGVTSHRSGDLETLGSSIRYFLRSHPTIQFIHGAHSPQNPRAAKALGVPISRVQTRPMQPVDRYPSLWDGIDIALCPLNPIDFNRAKSAVKAMESSAAGVPYIASDLDEYGWYGCGRLASAPSEWGSHLEALLEQGERQVLADEAHLRVQGEDVSARWSEWMDTYSDPPGGGAGKSQ